KQEDGKRDSLDRHDFIAACLARLQPAGWAALNLLGRNPDFPARRAQLERIAGERLHGLPASPSGNVIALLGDAPFPPQEALTAAAEALQQGTGLDLGPTLARLTRS
ncbi:MAG: hypothetical protein RIR00_1233, partial [Pseudomonadota bacterium]